MKNIVIAMLLLLSPTFAFADQGVEKRLQTLEAKQAELYHTLAEKKAAGLASAITDKITLSGLIELEAGLEDVEFVDGTSDASSDLTLATAQLGFGVEVNEHISGDLILLFEEGEDFTVDEAAINLTNDVLFGRFGLQYIPFGVFNSHFISDPMTLELGETQETAVTGGYQSDLFTLSAFLYNGEAEKEGNEDHLRDWGASLTVTPAEGLEFGASYISDLADTGAELLEEDYQDRTAGWSAYAIVGLGDLELSGEYLGAVDSFDSADLDADLDGSGDKPVAWNVELSYAATENVEVALRYEGSDEFAGQPETQYGLSASWSPWENVSLSAEYLRGEFDKDFGANEDGDIQDERDLVTAQMAFEF